MSNLRFIERDGKMVLQELVEIQDGVYNFGKVWQDVPTHKEPKKVSVVDELASAIGQPCLSSGMTTAYWSGIAAKAAIEFMKKRMPLPYSIEVLERHSYYNQALKDVRKALFGEE